MQKGNIWAAGAERSIGVSFRQIPFAYLIPIISLPGNPTSHCLGWCKSPSLEGERGLRKTQTPATFWCWTGLGGHVQTSPAGATKSFSCPLSLKRSVKTGWSPKHKGRGRGSLVMQDRRGRLKALWYRPQDLRSCTRWKIKRMGGRRVRCKMVVPISNCMCQELHAHLQAVSLEFEHRTVGQTCRAVQSLCQSIPQQAILRDVPFCREADRFPHCRLVVFKKHEAA